MLRMLRTRVGGGPQGSNVPCATTPIALLYVESSSPRSNWREETLPSLRLALIATSVLLLGYSSHSIAQIRIGPDGVEVGPRDRPPPPPPREIERREPVRDELRERLFR